MSTTATTINVTHDSNRAAKGIRSSLNIKWFDDITIEDIPLVGGKNASLGEMFRELSARGVKVPYGFAVTAHGYRQFLKESGLQDEIDLILGRIHTGDLAALQKGGERIRQAILSSEFPPDLEASIIDAYTLLQGSSPYPVDVAVRSSATAEDLPNASFAGQQETFLHVSGHEALIECCRRAFASLFTDRAISYRTDKGFAHTAVALSIGVQRMVRADLASSGVMFTIDPETGFQNVVLINASYGLGENVVLGVVNPDEYCVFKTTLKQGFKPILNKTLGSKEQKLVYDPNDKSRLKNVPVTPRDRGRFAITDSEILQLADWGCIIEDHYFLKNGHFTPMDIEWAKDGVSGELFIVQARPETVQSQRDPSILQSYHLRQRGAVLVSGRSIGEKIATGTVRVIRNVGDMAAFQAGEILVTDKTDPDWEPIMKMAAGIVTDRGGRTCHAAIVSRELGVCAIVGTGNGTDVLKDGQRVTVSCAEGDIGYVYAGELPFEIEHLFIEEMRRPRTKVMLNVSKPQEVFALSFLPNDGVGLAREEFIVSSAIKVHPMALVDYEYLEDDVIKESISAMTEGYAHKPDYFVDKLAQGTGTIAAAFYPKDVILRLSDFKTNEYAELIGGRLYEPVEENPMLGFRGASRYYHPRYQAGFALECLAVKRVREEMGLSNLKVMIPFCRTLEEAKRVQLEMEKHGLKRGVNGLELYVMCEIPSNVILADGFADLFDGFSIGSNDLTQLVLGVDRDSEVVAPLFDERNQAVKEMISRVIAVCRQRGKKIGICGQAPSDYSEFTQFLVEAGIDSISLNPDAVLKTTKIILDAEDAQRQSPK